VAILCVLEGVRPKEPIFAATRGYTRELWEMTMSCWKEDPSDRPTVDCVLAALKSVAGVWKPKHGALAVLSPRNDWSPTLAEESDSAIASEHESEPPTTPASLDTFQLPVIKPLVPTEPPATVDSRTPYPPSDTAKTVPSASSTAAGTHSQRTSVTRLTPDETLDRLLVRAKSPLGEDAVQKLVDALEKVSGGYPLPMGRFT